MQFSNPCLVHLFDSYFVLMLYTLELTRTISTGTDFRFNRRDLRFP